MRQDPATILFVEDNEAHAALTMRAFEGLEEPPLVCHVSDGEAAMEYLNRVSSREVPRPRVVLLDLRLPRIDGLDILKEIKRSPELRDIPVVILTSSEATSDIDKAYDNHANSYLIKPIDFGEFRQMMNSLARYWVGWNRMRGS